MVELWHLNLTCVVGGKQALNNCILLGTLSPPSSALRFSFGVFKYNLMTLSLNLTQDLKKCLNPVIYEPALLSFSIFPTKSIKLALNSFFYNNI